MKIYLIGLPGSGKTTLGKQLAAKKRLSFLDLDHEIESAEGKSIPEIFEQDGEDYFRLIEQKQLYATEPLTDVVISTGGGAPCFFDNMDFILNNGSSIFIDVSATELASRVANGPQNRPLLAELNKLKETLSTKRNQRLPYYSKANFTIEGDNIQVGDLLEKL